MTSPGARQQEAPTRSGNSGEGNDNHLAAGVTPNSTRLPHQDLLDELDAITTAWIAGYETGHAQGLAAHLADLHAAATHQVAARIVTAMATYPERDPEADKAAAQRRAANYGQPPLKAGAA